MKYKFIPRFVDIINNCKLNLNSLNPKILKEIASQVDFLHVMQLRVRNDGDYFINNLTKLLLESLASKVELFRC